MSNSDEKNKKRYFNNDIIATAFELFQTNQNFYDALKLLISIVGIRYNLDRVTVGETDLERGVARSLCSWTEGKHISPPSGEHKFSRENFERLFNSYDDNGIAILDSKAIKTYSKDTRIIEIDKNKSVLYSAMYNEGKYVGAVSYVVYSDDKVWAEEEKTDLGELTKVISMYLSKNNQINSCSDVCCNENDIITGLISFHKFKEELEKRIIGGRALSDIVAYFDFEGFNHFNHRYGYNQGDMVLKDFSKIIVDGFKGYPGVFFSRENADKFVLFMPYKGEMLEYKEILEKLFKKFSSGLGEKYKGTHLNIRCGIYRIDDKCKSASIAIDAANYARKQIKEAKSTVVCIYTELLAKKQYIESDVINNTENAFRDKEFKLYLQPRFSVEDCSIVGAEALVRWQRKDGTMLYPDAFIPIYEQNGTIVDLDFYMFEEVAAYLKKNEKLGRKQVPISINASILHALNDNTVQRYIDILKKYDIDPKLTEIELTETATASDYENVKHLYENLRKVNIGTAMDDFGAGYSVFNMIMDIPVTTVKIDRGFVNTCTTSENGIYFLQSMIKLIRGLGFHVVCEGIETEEQLNILKEVGCEEAQGFWFAKPMPVEDFERLMYA